MIENITHLARLSRQNLQLGTFTLRVLEDSHPKLAAQVLRGRSLRGWYKAMLDGEDFDADAWAIEREGIAGSDEPEEQVYRNRQSSKSEGKNDSDDVDEGKSSRPSTSQTDRTDDSEVDTRLRNNKKKKDDYFSSFENGCDAMRDLTNNYGHLNVWDKETLKRELLNAGFSSAKVCQFGEGENEDLVKDLKDRAFQTIYLEAKK